MPEITIKGGDLIKKWCDEISEKTEKAMLHALQATVYESMMQMINDIKFGRLGLQPTSQYGMGVGRPAKNNPLEPIANGVTYVAPRSRTYKGVKSLVAYFGFGAKPGTGLWQTRIAKKSARANGYRWHYSNRKLKSLHEIGIHLRKETIKRGAKVPQRHIIAAFEKKYSHKILSVLKNYFIRKLKGEWIEANKGGFL